MSETKPDAAELHLRARLHHLVNGPTAEPPAMPPGPPPDGYRTAPRPADDWWDRLYGDDPTPALVEDRPKRGPVELPGPVVKEPAQPKAKERKPTRRRRPAYSADQQQPAPRLSLLDAWDRTPHRLKWLAYHATAAGAGWWPGWVDWATDTAAWYAAGHWVSAEAFALYGLGVLACGVYRRSRAWAWPIAWAAAVPVSSIVVGVLLYAPTQ